MTEAHHPQQTGGDSGSPGPDVSGPRGVAELLRGVRSEVAASGSGAGTVLRSVERGLSELDARLHLVLAEHEGMGNELLQAYEQLGIVFDITRRLASADDDNDVVRVFIACLRTTFNRCCFATARLSGEAAVNICLWDALDGFGDESALAALVAESTHARRVVVRELENPATPQVMACPVFAGADPAWVLIIIRREAYRPFTSADMLLMDSLSTFCGDIIRNLRLVHELRQLSIDMVRALVGTIDQKDGYTSGHSNRVGHYACMLARELSWSDERLQVLEWSALLHDVGKIGIRDDVLKKAGKLTSDEFEHMKEHPVRSSEVVRQVPQLAEAIDGVLYHHEHWDGCGYPDGLAGEEIPLQARIIQIADIFDALTTGRSYREAFTWRKALSILRDEAGVVVDPHLVPIFERLILERAARDPVGFERLFEAGAADEDDQYRAARDPTESRSSDDEEEH